MSTSLEGVKFWCSQVDVSERKRRELERRKKEDMLVLVEASDKELNNKLSISLYLSVCLTFGLIEAEAVGEVVDRCSSSNWMLFTLRKRYYLICLVCEVTEKERLV